MVTVGSGTIQLKPAIVVTGGAFVVTVEAVLGSSVVTVGAIKVAVGTIQLQPDIVVTVQQWHLQLQLRGSCGYSRDSWSCSRYNTVQLHPGIAVTVGVDIVTVGALQLLLRQLYSCSGGICGYKRGSWSCSRDNIVTTEHSSYSRGTCSCSRGQLWLQTGQLELPSGQFSYKLPLQIQQGQLLLQSSPLQFQSRSRHSCKWLLLHAIGPIPFKVNQLLVQVGPLQDKVGPDCATYMKFFHKQLAFSQLLAKLGQLQLNWSIYTKLVKKQLTLFQLQLKLGQLQLNCSSYTKQARKQLALFKLQLTLCSHSSKPHCG